MGSQFVDLNADGHLDYLTATFDGSPHIAYGSAEGFAEPEHLKDVNGERLLIASFWNFEAEEHQTTGRALGTDTPPSERCISAWAFDWDADGDLDLLLGSYENGHLYLQMNEGTKSEHKFTGKNIPVMAGDKPFEIAEKMTAPRMLDWDGDGDLDILAGSFGDGYGQTNPGGGVYLARNIGETGKPKFAALETLIERSKKGQSSPTRPDAGLYADALDYDGDGDLDLIVGAYSMWTPEARELTDAEKAQAGELTARKTDLQTRRGAVTSTYRAEVAAVSEGKDPKSAEVMEAVAAARKRYSENAGPLSAELKTVTDALNELVPSPMREPFVWLYERR